MNPNSVSLSCVPGINSSSKFVPTSSFPPRCRPSLSSRRGCRAARASPSFALYGVAQNRCPSWEACWTTSAWGLHNYCYVLTLYRVNIYIYMYMYIYKYIYIYIYVNIYIYVYIYICIYIPFVCSLRGGAEPLPLMGGMLDDKCVWCHGITVIY